MKKICCVGHVTLDKIITPKATTYQNGGTSYYFAHGISKLTNSDFQLVTSLAESEMDAINKMRSENIDVVVFPSKNTVYFENKYGDNSDYRSQRVLAKADPFKAEMFSEIDAEYFHLGSLLADDFPIELVQYLSTKGTVSLDVQGYLRRVVGENVEAIDWASKRETLKYVDILKVNENEMRVLTGETKVQAAAEKLAQWGVKEVVITYGSLGSYIYSNGKMTKIPAYAPKQIVDATGCGDTYMTGYLFMRANGAGIHEAGCFAAAMSTLKLENFGPFNGTIDDIRKVIDRQQKVSINKAS